MVIEKDDKFPIQNQKLFDKVLPLASTIYKKKCYCQPDCTEPRDGINYEFFEFKIFDTKQLEYNFRYMTPLKYDDISEYLLYTLADIYHGQGYHTTLYIDENENFYIVHC